MNIKDYYEETTSFQKFELYIIVVIFFLSCNFLYDNYLVSNELKYTKSDTVLQNKILNLKAKIIKKEKTEIIKELDNVSEKFNLLTTSSSFHHEYIHLEFNGEFKDVINYLHYISLHFNIESFELHIDEELIKSSVKLQINHYFNPQTIQKPNKTIINPFINKVRAKKIATKKLTLKLYAIVSNNILINNTWYTKNDIVENHIILDIGKNKVKLKHKQTNREIILSVYEE